MKLEAGQLIKISRGGLEGTTVILLAPSSKTHGISSPTHQIWDVYILHSPCPYWKPGERVGIRGCDMVRK